MDKRQKPTREARETSLRSLLLTEQGRWEIIRLHKVVREMPSCTSAQDSARASGQVHAAMIDAILDAQYPESARR